MQTNSAPPAFESWGRYPKHRADIVPLYWTSDFPLSATAQKNGIQSSPMLPVGMGRSYGDSCLLDGGNGPRIGMMGVLAATLPGVVRRLVRLDRA